MPGRVYFWMHWKILTSRSTFGLARYQIFQLISNLIQPTGNKHCHNILYVLHDIYDTILCCKGREQCGGKRENVCF